MKYVKTTSEDILIRDQPTQDWKKCKVHGDLVCFRPDELPELITELQKALKKFEVAEPGRPK